MVHIEPFQNLLQMPRIRLKEEKRNVISSGKHSPVKNETLDEIEEICLEFNFWKNTEEEC